MSRYRVAGPHVVLDTAPGDVIDQEIPALQAAQLLSGGSIAEVAEGDEAAKEEAPAGVADASQGDG